MEERLLVTSYLDYQLFNESFKKYDNPNIYREYLEKIIEKIVAESSMDEKKAGILPWLCHSPTLIAPEETWFSSQGSCSDTTEAPETL